MDYWCWKNEVDNPAATLSVTVGGASGLLGIENLRDPRVGHIFRAGLMPSEIRIQLAASVPLSVFGIFGANLASMGTVTLKVGTTAGAADILSVAVTPFGRQHVTLLRETVYGAPLPTVAARHVTIAATGAVPMEIGRIWLGGVQWATKVGHSPDGSLWQAADLSVRSATARGGAFLIDQGRRLRTFTAGYRALYPDEYNGALFDFDLNYGLAAQVLFIPEPGVYPIDRWPILGYIRELPENRFVGYLRATRDMTIIEAG